MEITNQAIIETSNTTTWGGLPVTVYKGSANSVKQHLPKFERRTFGQTTNSLATDQHVGFMEPLPHQTGVNPYHDVIVRMPIKTTEMEVPVGVVSKNYTLVQHEKIFDAAHSALTSSGVEIDKVKAVVELTAFGERMRLSMLLPDAYNINIGDDKMGLRLECFNSVEGSMKFTCVIGWLRFVCSNGMVVGVADTYYRQRHNRQMEIGDIAALLTAGIKATTVEKDQYTKWSKKQVSQERLEQWINKQLAPKWGVKAATRTWHIVRTGHDVSFLDPFEKAVSTKKQIIPGKRVPGAVLPGDNVYAVIQALAWLAKERRNIQEQLTMKQEIQNLILPLVQ